MKKIIITSALAMLALSGAAHATGTGSLTGSGAVDTTQCTWLTSNINVSLSKGVVAAYDCNTASTNTTIFVGTSSSLGTTKTRTMACAVQTAGNQAANVNPVCNDASCTASFDANGGSLCTGSFTVSGSTLFSASSAGGTVSSGQLGGTCSKDDLTACGTSVLSAVSALAAAAEAAAAQ